MKCPFCAQLEDKVVDSRESKEGDTVRRRRECLGCGRRFTSYERIEEIPYMVVKRDGRREPFDRQKLLHGLMKACEKRPLPVNKLERMADDVESRLQEKPEKEIATSEIGAYIMERLKRLDKVAYVRFASVYRRFKAVGEFMSELKGLLRDQPKKARKGRR
jgi:transcriptional repressor NrdR